MSDTLWDLKGVSLRGEARNRDGRRVDLQTEPFELDIGAQALPHLRHHALANILDALLNRTRAP